LHNDGAIKISKEEEGITGSFISPSHGNSQCAPHVSTARHEMPQSSVRAGIHALYISCTLTNPKGLIIVVKLA